MPKIPRIARPSFVSVATFLLLIVFSLTITSLGKWLLSLKDEQKVSSCFSQQEEIHVLKFLKNRGLEQYNNTFIDKKVKGSLFLLLTLNELEEHFLITSPFHARYLATEIELLREGPTGLDCPIPTSIEKENPKLIGSSKLWNTEQVLLWLESEMEVSTQVRSAFEKMKVSGAMLKFLTDNDLATEFGLADSLVRLRILGAIMSLPSEFIVEDSHTSAIIQAAFGHLALVGMTLVNQVSQATKKSKGIQNLLLKMLSYLDVVVFGLVCIFGFCHLLFSVEPDLVLNVPSKSLQKTLLSIYSALSAKKGYRILRNIFSIFCFHFGSILVAKFLSLFSLIGATQPQKGGKGKVGANDEMSDDSKTQAKSKQFSEGKPNPSSSGLPSEGHVSEAVVVFTNHLFLLGTGFLENYGFRHNKRNWSRLLFHFIGPIFQFLLLSDYLATHIEKHGAKSNVLVRIGHHLASKIIQQPVLEVRSVEFTTESNSSDSPTSSQVKKNQ